VLLQENIYEFLEPFIRRGEQANFAASAEKGRARCAPHTHTHTYGVVLQLELRVAPGNGAVQPLLRNGNCSCDKERGLRAPARPHTFPKSHPARAICLPFWSRTQQSTTSRLADLLLIVTPGGAVACSQDRHLINRKLPAPYAIKGTRALARGFILIAHRPG
jgi:hypothetical protein